MYPKLVNSSSEHDQTLLHRKINDEKDVIFFKQQSPAFRNLTTYIDLLSERIYGSSDTVINHKYTLKNEIFSKCSIFIKSLEKQCEETDLKLAQTSGTLRFGHVAFRTWFDAMKGSCRQFIDELAGHLDSQYREELFSYLTESFGNKMRIDYGTGHELNFIIFTMGLSNLVLEGGDLDLKVTQEKLKKFVETHGWDIHSLFAHSYLKLCRRLQVKFRLEPAGSRGVYNMDDFQYLPFLFGTAQLAGLKHISTKDFYQFDQVDLYKNDYIFFEAVDFILTNKRGPFNEHSYTLWGFTNLGSWDNIFRRIKFRFTDDILSPFPILQHFLFGNYILRWISEQDST